MTATRPPDSMAALAEALRTQAPKSADLITIEYPGFICWQLPRERRLILGIEDVQTWVWQLDTDDGENLDGGDLNPVATDPAIVAASAGALVRKLVNR